MEYLFIYLLQLAEIFQNVAILGMILGTLALVMFIIISIVCLMENLSPDEEPVIHKLKEDFGKYCIIIFSIAIVAALLPSKQTALLLGGTFIGKKAIESVSGSETISKINTLIDLQLDKYIKDLSQKLEDNK